MKFGYRDRIILLVVCVIVIFGIGIFVFIKPKYEKLKDHRDQRDTLADEWKIQLHEFEMIPTRQTKIEKNYQEATDIAENFTDEMNAVELDQFLQEQFMNIEDHVDDDGKATVKLVSGLSVSDETTASLGYYYYTPSIVTYALYEYADMDGSLAAAAAEKRKEADILSARGSQSVGAGTSSFTVLITREDTMKLIDAIHQYAVDHSDAMLIRSVDFEDYHFNSVPGQTGAAAATPGAEGETGATAGANTGITEETEGYTKVTISYDVYYMQEPTKPDVGPSYDASVWDNGQWKTYGGTEEADSAAS